MPPWLLILLRLGFGGFGLAISWTGFVSAREALRSGEVTPMFDLGHRILRCEQPVSYWGGTAIRLLSVPLGLILCIVSILTDKLSDSPSP